MACLHRSESRPCAFSGTAVVLVPRILLEAGVRSQYREGNREQNAIWLVQTRRTLERPRAVELAHANQVLTALAFVSELEQTLFEDCVAHLCLRQTCRQRLRWTEHARANDVY